MPGRRETMSSLKTVSYGGGVQSTALLVLAAQAKIDFPIFLMANVGDDSEHPATLKYVREIAAPYAEAHGIELHMLDRHKRDGSVETLKGRLTREGSRSLTIPVRLSSGAPASRSCTADFKTRVIGKWLKSRGATADSPATVAIGISVDEIHRATSKKVEPYERVVYPLLDLRLRRDDCMRLIAEAGLPVPPKSSCYFCPWHSLSAWRDLAHDEPELFEKACQLEDYLRERNEGFGKGPVWLSDTLVPLRDSINHDEQRLPFDEHDAGCDSGWCMT
jgi:PP-loop superfamily ATP-utilizing enzyme